MSGNRLREQTRVVACYDLAFTTIQLLIYVILFVILVTAIYSRNELDLSWLFRWLNYEGFDVEPIESALMAMQVTSLNVLALWFIFKLICADDIVRLIKATDWEVTPERAISAIDIWKRGTLEFIVLDVVLIFQVQRYWLLVLKLVPVVFLILVHRFEEELNKQVQKSAQPTVNEEIKYEIQKKQEKA